MQINTTGVRDNGANILLMLQPSPELLAERNRIIACVPDQTPVRELHITLMRSPRSDIPLPPAPASLQLLTSAQQVSDGDKTSIFLAVTPSSQEELARYVTAIEQALGVSGFQNKERVFHVSLTNRVGDLNASVADVWNHPCTPV